MSYTAADVVADYTAGIGRMAGELARSRNRSYLRLSIAHKGPGWKRYRNASLRGKVTIKRWLLGAGEVLARDLERQMVNLVVYGTSHPEAML